MGEVLQMANNDSISSNLVANTRIGTLGDMGELNAAEYAFTGRGSNRPTGTSVTIPAHPVQAIQPIIQTIVQPPAAVFGPVASEAPAIVPLVPVALDPIRVPDLVAAPEAAPELPGELAPAEPAIRTKSKRSNRGVSHQYSGYALAAQEYDAIYTVLESEWEEVTTKCFDEAHNILVLGEVEDMVYIEHIVHVDNPGDE